MMKKTVADLKNLAGKRVFVRVDFNVPLDGTTITDDKRIRAALPTLQYLIDKGAKVIVASHLGRPKGIVVPSMSLKPVADRLAELLNKQVTFAPDCVGPEVEALAEKMQNGDVLLLENLRFHPEEEKNDPEFAKQLAKLAHIFVSDAFGTVHRAHASTAGICADMEENAAGFLVEKELTFLGGALDNPVRPFVGILGGSKVSSKIAVINSLLDKCDTLILGGGMTYTFMKAQGGTIGTSLFEEDTWKSQSKFLKQPKPRTRHSCCRSTASAARATICPPTKQRFHAIRRTRFLTVGWALISDPKQENFSSMLSRAQRLWSGMALSASSRLTHLPKAPKLLPKRSRQAMPQLSSVVATVPPLSRSLVWLPR